MLERVTDAPVPETQVTGESPAQVPVNSWNCLVLPKLVPKSLNVIVAETEVATNWYHTSSTFVPLQGAGTESPDAVAPASVPKVFIQVEFRGKLMTPAQSSLAGAGGGSETQISKSPLNAPTGSGSI